MSARFLTEEEIARFPGASSVNVAIRVGSKEYYADGNPTEYDPSGLSDAQFVTDEDGDYIEIEVK